MQPPNPVATCALFASNSAARATNWTESDEDKDDQREERQPSMLENRSFLCRTGEIAHGLPMKTEKLVKWSCDINASVYTFEHV